MSLVDVFSAIVEIDGTSGEGQDGVCVLNVLAGHLKYVQPQEGLLGL
jgi:hypothetical protein